MELFNLERKKFILNKNWPVFVGPNKNWPVFVGLNKNWLVIVGPSSQHLLA